jgi:hypothetical protein
VETSATFSRWNLDAARLLDADARLLLRLGPAAVVLGVEQDEGDLRLALELEGLGAGRARRGGDGEHACGSKNGLAHHQTISLRFDGSRLSGLCGRLVVGRGSRSGVSRRRLIRYPDTVSTLSA